MVKLNKGRRNSIGRKLKGLMLQFNLRNHHLNQLLRRLIAVIPAAM